MNNLDFFIKDETQFIDKFDFDEVSKEVLQHYRDFMFQGTDPFFVFKRLNDSFRLIHHEKASDAFLTSFYELLTARLKSAISSSYFNDNKDDNQFYNEDNSSGVSEVYLNLLQVERELKERSISIPKQHTLEFDKKIRANDGWIEKSFLEEQNLKANTFFIPTIYEQVTSRPDYFSNKQRNSKFSGQILDGIFSKLENGPFSKSEKTKNKISKALNRHSPDLFYGREFETLIAIHHELAENSLSHAINSRINHKSSSNNMKTDFGLLAYLQVQLFDYPNKNNFYGLSHDAFDYYHKYINRGPFGLGRKKEKSYLSISYCDTGLGIQQHLQRFGNTQEEALQQLSRPQNRDWENCLIQEIIEERGTTRDFSGSGFGLRKSTTYTQHLEAFLCIDTPTSHASYNGVTDKWHETAGRTNRGTLISLVIPVG